MSFSKGGLKLITLVRAGMKNKLMDMEEKILLRKRSIVETIIISLKIFRTLSTPGIKA